MTEMQRQPITHESAWRPADTNGKEGLRIFLDKTHLEALHELLQRTKGKHKHAVTRADFTHPALDAKFAEIRDTVMHGRGAALITGIDRARYDDEELERLYWGLGTHMGTAVVQSVYGDLMGYVEVAENDPYARAYRSNDELNPHCDTHEFVGLMCVQRAEVGGLSRLASTLTIHNELLARPDLLEALYEGYYLAPPELQHSSHPVTDVKTPIYCKVGDVVSCTYGGSMIRRAAEALKVPMPEKLAEAMKEFQKIAARPDVLLEFQLEPGEILLWQNFTNIHSRTSFENSATRKRKLLRLWARPHEPRPVDPRFYSRAEAYFAYYKEKAGETAKVVA